nr:lysozyme inhibitor LprI family protein [uncultured Albidiferax sp.]
MTRLPASLSNRLVACLTIFTLLSGTVSYVHATNAEVSAMTNCGKAAGNKSGNDRKTVMIQCLSAHSPTSNAEAQKPAQDVPCGSGGVMATIQCMTPMWDQAERSMSIAYVEVLEKLKAEGLPRLVENLERSQQAWKSYRQAQCFFHASVLNDENSWNTVFQSDCEADEARRRTDYLSNLPP